MRFADWPELAEIINKVIESLTQEEHDAIVKWCRVRLEYRANWSQLLKWISAVSALSSFWHLPVLEQKAGKGNCGA
ncbi:MAG: hypothetical protein R2941_20350 [Desulfobacterales bacterium]